MVFSIHLQADRLEDYLGLEFVEKPRKVLITPRNKVAIIANSILLPFRNLGLLMLALETNSSIAGTYELEYNIMFIKSDSPYTSLHENMHALARQINPRFFQTGIEAFSQVLAARSLRKPHPKDGAEKMWLVTIFDEGMAETGALHV